MTSGRRGRGLIVAGLIVIGVWLAVTLGRLLEIPAYWTPVFVGAALIVAGAVRWRMGGG